MFTYKISIFFILFCLLNFIMCVYLTEQGQDSSQEEELISNEIALPSIKQSPDVITEILESCFHLIHG